MVYFCEAEAIFFPPPPTTPNRHQQLHSLAENEDEPQALLDAVKTVTSSNALARLGFFLLRVFLKLLARLKLQSQSSRSHLVLPLLSTTMPNAQCTWNGKAASDGFPAPHKRDVHSSSRHACLWQESGLTEEAASQEEKIAQQAGMGGRRH